MDYMDTLLTEDLLAEEAFAAQTATDDPVSVDGIRRRFDRQVGLLRALPEGWAVYRLPDRMLPGDAPRGSYFTAYDANGSQVAQARRLNAGRIRVRQVVSWGGTSGASAGEAWAQGIVLLLAAIDAEAHGAPPVVEPVAD